MRGKSHTGEFIAKLVALSVFGGLGWSFLFALFVRKPYSDILPFGFLFGAMVALAFAILRVTSGKVVEDSIPFERQDDFLPKMKAALDKLKYRWESKKGEVSEWKCVGPDAIFLENVAVKLEDHLAIIVGPKSIVKRLKKVIAAL